MAKEILIADSDKADQEKFQKIFETTDYHLVFSESGQDVLLRVKLFKPDLIIAGTALSEKNGLELCEVMKRDPEFRSIPFILLLNLREEISEKDRKRLNPDGILSKPLHEVEVLNVVDRLLEGMKAKAGEIPQKQKEWESLADMKKEDFLMNESKGKGEEEVIDLLDVVEESEAKMSINDFAVSGKEEPFGEMTSLETWGKLEEEEKLAAEEGFVLSVKEEGEKQEITPRLTKEAAPKRAAQEEELFEKIELEDILEKVGQMETSSEMEPAPEKEVRVIKEEPSPREEPEGEGLGLEEFEALLKKGVDAESPKAQTMEEVLQPFSIEESKAEVPEEVTPIEIPEEELGELEKLAEEAFPKGLLEEALKEEKGGRGGELEEEGLRGLEEELEGLKEKEIPDLEAEELEVIEEPKELEGFEEEKVGGLELEELEVVEEPRELKELKEESIGGLEAEELEVIEEPQELEELKEERVGSLDAEELEVIEEPQERKVLKEEKIELFEELEAPQVLKKKVKVFEKSKPIIFERPEEDEARKFFEEAFTPPPRRMDQEMEEVMSDRVRAMMEEFMTKHVPEMTKDIIGLTLERIEKMVKEIVPDLAVKMIEEEIKRLEKGERD
jgi:CheY-like chemotaxis protein